MVFPTFRSVVLLLALTGQAGAATLRIMQSEPPRSMDPADQTATFTASVLDPMYEGLVRMLPDGRIVPRLALSWTTSPDGLDWRFILRPGVRFHDGTVLTSIVAAQSFARLLSATSGLVGAGHYGTIIASIRPDGPALLIHLSKPYAFLLQLLAGAQADLVSPAAARAGTLGRIPVGTGPYRFVTWKSSDYVEEERNPDYWGPRPAIDRLRWSWSPEASVMNMALRTGEIDVAVPFPALFASRLGDAPFLRLQQQPGAAIYFVALNTRLPPLNDPNVRHAISLATDRPALVAALLHGFGEPDCGPLPPATLGCGQATPALAYDPVRARTLLAEVGLPHGFALSVAVQEPEEPIAEALQAMWAKAGIRLSIHRLEAGVWVDAAFAGPAAKQQDRLGAVITSWAAPFVPDLQLRPLFASRSEAPAGANLGFFSDPALDQAMDNAARTLDTAARDALYRDIARRLDAAAAHISLYTPSDLVAHASRVSGLAVLPGGELQLEHATLTGPP